MTKFPKTLTFAVLGGWLVCHRATAYEIAVIPDQNYPNPAQVEFVVDSPSRGKATFRTMRMLGGDHYAGYGAMCDGPVSCVRLFVTENGKTRLFEKTSRACLPYRGPGLLSDAATSFVAQHFTGVTIPQRSNVYGDVPSSVQINIRNCDNPSYHVVYQSDGSPTAPLVCVIDAPATVHLGQLSESTTRTVRTPVACSGGGEADIRVSVVGPSSISPVRGLKLWTSAPERALHITGDGAPSYVDLTVGATVDSPKPGMYSGSFIYTIEYL